jgi:hypothetical protein
MNDATDKLVEYTYDEFLIDLPAHWVMVKDGKDEYLLNWQSEQEKASLTISAEFREIPVGTQSVVARMVIANRKELLEKTLGRPVTTLHETAKPNAQVGYNVSFGLDGGEDFIMQYAGYISTRKILHVTLVSSRGKFEASKLFQKLVDSLRVKLP